MRVKVLFNKKDTALIQFVDAAQAQKGAPKYRLDVGETLSMACNVHWDL